MWWVNSLIRSTFFGFPLQNSFMYDAMGAPNEIIATNATDAVANQA